MAIHNGKIELIPFRTRMGRYREFLNQSKVFSRIDAIKSIHCIKTEGGTAEDYKISFLSEFTELVFSNNIDFKKLNIETDLYGYGPSELSFIRFEIECITEIRDEGDYKVYEADIIFNLNDNKWKTVKYEFIDDKNDDFSGRLSYDKYYNEFKFVDEDEEIFYKEFEERGKYRIILNDLFQYLDFAGANFYNKSFVQPEIIGYDYENFLRNASGKYKDKNWQINRGDFMYVDEVDETLKPSNTNDLTSDQLFNYALHTYYQEYRFYQLTDDIFKVVEYLDILISKKYPMAFLTKAILHIDGVTVFKDLAEAKQLLKEAYNLGLTTPSLLVWNENKL